MKQILTCPAALIRQFPIAPDNTITNRALRLPLHRAIRIAFKRRQRVDQGAVENGNGAERRAQPRLPFGFVDGDAGEAFDVRVGEGDGGREGDAHGHCLVVDEVGGGDFAGARSDTNGEGGGGVGLLLRGGPRIYGGEGGGYDGG
jgi:hypothetical protein